MKRLVLACLSLLLIVALCQTTSLAQTHSPTLRAEGELKGLVLDPNDARIAGAKITLQDKERRFEVWTNDEGAFQIKLPAGEYQLKIEGSGFKDYIRRRVRIEADKTETLNVTLRPADPRGLLKVEKVR